MSGDRQRGLYGKYRVERIQDPTGKHHDCRYFVLDPQHDPIARKALRIYAIEAERAGYVALAVDLQHLFDETDGEVEPFEILDLDDPYFDGQSLPDALRDYQHVHSTKGACVKHPTGDFCQEGSA